MPVAISAVTAEILQLSGANEIRQLNQLAPSLLVSSTGRKRTDRRASAASARSATIPGSRAGLKLLALPFMLGFYLADSSALAIASYLFNYPFASSYLGPTFALIQGLAPLRMRAMWAAVTLLVINLIGLGLGPTLVGVLSDMLEPYAGAESLRSALVIMAAATPRAIFHYWRAGVLRKRMGA